MHTPRGKIVAYLLLILVGRVPTLPNFLPAEALSRLPASFAQSRITLGLDLRGGSHLVLEVDSAKLQEKALQSLADDLARELTAAGLPEAGIRAEAGEIGRASCRERVCQYG